MKSIRFPVALVAALLSQQVLAQKAPDQGWYVGFGVGGASADVNTQQVDASVVAAGAASSNTTGDDNDTGGKVYLGYQFNKNFALEGGFASLGKYKFTTVTTGPAMTINSDIRARALYMDLVGILPMTDRFALHGTLGLHSTKLRGHFTNTAGATINNDQSDGGGKIGIGARYDFNNQWSVRVDGEHFGNADISLFSIGLQVRF